MLKITSNELSRSMLNDLTSAQKEISKIQKEIVTGQRSQPTFMDHLTESISSVNKVQVKADKLATDVASEDPPIYRRL